MLAEDKVFLFAPAPPRGGSPPPPPPAAIGSGSNQVAVFAGTDPPQFTRLRHFADGTRGSSSVRIRRFRRWVLPDAEH